MAAKLSILLIRRFAGICASRRPFNPTEHHAFLRYLHEQPNVRRREATPLFRAPRM